MIKNKKFFIRIAVILVTAIFLLLFRPLSNTINSETENLFAGIRGEIQPDTNIVLIHITDEDLQRIGPWPIKRNYYALLVNELTKLGVKKIGLEIFLSSRFVTQTIYDNLLENEIEKSGKVVLSSVVGQITEKDGKFFTDSLSYPSPKLLNESFPTGHLNYIKDTEFKIPLIINNRGIGEKAFAFQLADEQTFDKSIMVNFVSSWKKFKSYSATEFSELAFSDSKKLTELRDKFVIIGVSDPQIAPAIETTFDEQLPGFALHAFALDNILDSRSINTKFYFLSGVIFILIILLFIFYQEFHSKKSYLTYVTLLIAIFTISFVLSAFLYIKLTSAFFISPFVVLIIFDAITKLAEKKVELEGIIGETEALRSLLSKKEKELSQLQKELNSAFAETPADKISDEESVQLIVKIKSLKSDIEKLRESEKDRTGAMIESQNHVENFHGIVYRSKVMTKIADLIEKAAPTDTTILIIGESGTGKELVARAIHSLSERKENNFVAVNCGALTESLLESELFGYVRGAFTGANTDKLGRFEIADNGTIFLDEIGETSENFQVKLLRVLQSGEIEKVGSTKQYHVNVRVVAATNKELDSLVKEKKFRKDLYYRLNVFQIVLPPLRERKEDIDIIANHFLKAEGELYFSKAVIQALNDYDWKGNVRELQSVIKRAAIFAKSDKRNMIQLSDLPGELVKEAKYNFEDLVLESLRSKKFSHSSITETAKELGNVNRTMIAENFRGIVFKILIENNFDIDKTVVQVAVSSEEEVKEKVHSKIQTLLANIEDDVKRINKTDFETVKKNFSSKYKNLPVKFHSYLDEVIKQKLTDLNK